MRNCGLPERGKTACLMNNLSQAAALPPNGALRNQKSIDTTMRVQPCKAYL